MVDEINNQGDQSSENQGDQSNQSQSSQHDQQGSGTQQGSQQQNDKGFWPDSWRERWASDDPKKLQFAQRYTSPEAALDALVSANNKIRSGEYKATLPKNANEQEIAEWRKSNGIPESPEKYDLKFDNGLVIGDEDKPIIDGFLKSAHQANYTPEQAKGAVQWYYDEQKRMADDRNQRDEQQKQEALDKLNAEWGPEFRQNMNMVNGLLNSFPEEIRDSLKGGRLADGTGIFNNPQVIRGFAELALKANPAARVVPSSFGNEKQGLEEEIGRIEKVMATNRSAYNKDESMQNRYRELLSAREQMKGRN